jgi:nitroimidazol reductase NimA-like FMN-containing flavoprotein (pyridoxamine 5'-phosphate oxidase superfamily)
MRDDLAVTSDPIDVQAASPTLDRAACMTLLRACEVGRVVYTADAMPAIAPVNYVVDVDTIAIHTDSESRLSAAGRHDVVAFEVDEIDEATGAGWSVVVVGRTSEITSADELDGLVAASLRSWTSDGPGRYLRISCDIVTGQRLSRLTK